MAIITEVPKDLDEIKTKLIFNLTKRQLVCFALAAAAGGGGYFLTKDYLGTSAAAFILVAAAMPFFLLAMYTRDGFPAEKLLWFAVRHRFLSKPVRKYDKSTKFTRAYDRNKLEEELMILEEKAGIGKRTSEKRKNKSRK